MAIRYYHFSIGLAMIILMTIAVYAFLYSLYYMWKYRESRTWYLVPSVLIFCMIVSCAVVYVLNDTNAADRSITDLLFEFGTASLLTGACAIGMVIFDCIREAIRAARTSHRLVTAMIRTHFHDRRKPTWKEWWMVFRRDYFTTYESKKIGIWAVPHDPNKPITKW